VEELEASKISALKVNMSASLESSFAGPELRHGPHLASSGRYKTTGRGFNSGLVNDLKRDFGDMPGPQRLKKKDYAVVNVSPSVIPTYLPGIRIFSCVIFGQLLVVALTADTTSQALKDQVKKNPLTRP
jgi:endopolyphosphatase